MNSKRQTTQLTLAFCIHLTPYWTSLNSHCTTWSCPCCPILMPPWHCQILHCLTTQPPMSNNCCLLNTSTTIDALVLIINSLLLLVTLYDTINLSLTCVVWHICHKSVLSVAPHIYHKIGKVSRKKGDFMN